MAATYIETLAKLQKQGLETLKQAQDAHIASLGAMREYASAFPAFSPDAIPTVAQLAELGTSFATQLFEQQVSYANRLAAVLTPKSTQG